jgi:hypothetical protein
MKALALLVTVLALLAAGCGGDDGDEASSADVWAEDFCTLVTDWEDELERIRDELGDVADLSSDALETAAEDADAVTQDLIDNLRDLGAPDTPSGDAVEQEVEELGDTIDAEREEIREAVDDADGLAGLAEAVGVVGASLAAMATALEETLRSIDEADAEGELRTALDESPACEELDR